MGEVSTIGLDIAKSVFQVHGVDGAGAVVICKRISRVKVLEFFAGLPSCLVGIEDNRPQFPCDFATTKPRDRARTLLRRLEEDDCLQRRIKWLALRSIVSLRQMRTVATRSPKLKSMDDRDRWLAECKLVESILLKISKRGVG
jgi:hypothetical protein